MHLADERINIRIDVIGGKQARPQILIAVNPSLPEINVGEHLAPSRVVEKVSPVVGCRGAPIKRAEIASVCRALRPVKIPDGAENELALARLIKIRAEAQGIHIEGHDVEDVVVYPGTDINIGGIAHSWIGVVGRIERVPKGVHIVLNVLRLGRPLGRQDVRLLRIAIDNRLPGGVKPVVIRRPCSINAQHVPARDRRRRIVVGLEFVNVNSVCAARDLLLQHVNAVVIARS
jgi:hypothetical protein